MSKKVGYIIAVAGLAALGFSLPLLNTTGVRADEARPTENLIATTTGLAQKMDETVYVFLNTDGTVKKTISSDWSKNDLGADVYTKTEGKVSTPVTMKISYFLDDKAVSAEEIRGRSGHIKIRYDFTNNERVNGMFVPVAVLSGAVLPNEVFSNVKLTNAKLINDGTRMMVAGLALPGMKENLGVNIDIPEYFEIEADVKEFKMEMTATVATSKIFADLDTSALNSVDALSTALQTLSDSMLQLLDGSTKLRDGLSELNSKTSILANGVSELRAGSLELAAGAKELSDGLELAATGSSGLAVKIGEAAEGVKLLDSKISEKVEDLNQKVSELAASEKLANSAKAAFDTTVEKLKTPGTDDAPNPMAHIFANVTFETYEKESVAIKKVYSSNEIIKNYLEQLDLYYGTYKYVMTMNSLVAGLPGQLAGLKVYTAKLASSTEGLPFAAEKTKELAGKLSDATIGANGLASGMASLDAGISNLESNVPALTSGVSQLAGGSKALSDGLLQFNDEGVQRLVSLYNGNVKALVSKIQTMVNLAKSANKIKYIYRTDEI